MPKRSIEERMERYRKKLRKLEEKEHDKHRRRIRVIDSSESDADNCSGIEDVQGILPEQPSDILGGLEVPQTIEEPDTPALDPDVLLALGEADDEAPKFGEPIHANLAQRWEPILKRGIPKDAKEKLLKAYPVPANCSLLQAPKINAEISAAVTDVARNRDKKMESTQQQLGIGITAVNRGLSLLLTSDEKIQAIKLLSDGCRILTDLHHTNTLARIKLLTPGLDKTLVSNIIKDTERDDTLFGSKLSEKIKASKTIEKQGLQIKKSVASHKIPAQTPQSTVVRPRYQENWAGPSRYPSNNRGGRGGARKPLYPSRRMPAPPQHKAQQQNRPRAPTQQ